MQKRKKISKTCSLTRDYGLRYVYITKAQRGFPKNYQIIKSLKFIVLQDSIGDHKKFWKNYIHTPNGTDVH